MEIDKLTTSPVIAKACRWSNDMVAVFDQFGRQMPDYQGRYADVRERVVGDAPPDARFVRVSWNVPGETAFNRTHW